MRQQCRARHSLGDGTLGRSGLVDRPAGAAPVFGAANAQNAQPCRHEVEHLADCLADVMERATAAGTDALINIDRHILARLAIMLRFSWSIHVNTEPAGASFGAYRSTHIFRPEAPRRAAPGSKTRLLFDLFLHRSLCSNAPPSPNPAADPCASLAQTQK